MFIAKGFINSIFEDEAVFSGLRRDKDTAWALIKSPNRNNGYREDEDQGTEEWYDGDGVEFLVTKLDTFTGLDREIAFELIRAGKAEQVFQNARLFHDFDLNKEEALALATQGYPFSNAVINHLEKFSGLDAEVAMTLITDGHCSRAVVQNAGVFSNFQLNKEVALTIIQSAEIEVDVIINNIGEFTGFDKEFAAALISAGQSPTEFVLGDLDRFGISAKECVLLILSDKRANYYLENNTIAHNCTSRVKGEITLDDLMQVQSCHVGNLVRIASCFTSDLESILKNPKMKNYLVSEVSRGQAMSSEPENGDMTLEKGVRLARAERFEAELETEDKEAWKRLCDRFGVEKISDFIGRQETNYFHIAADNILALHDRTGMDACAFYGQVLAQVANDGSEYEFELSSHDFLNLVARDIESYGQSTDKVLAKARQFDNPHLRELLTDLEGRGPYSSWKYLKKFHAVIKILQKREVIERLEEIRDSGNKALYEYASRLAFHPNIDMNAVMQFALEPDAFLGIGEQHAPDAHERKKPSNYIEIPHLDLTAEDMRDALSGGTLDRIQFWQPLRIEYEILRGGQGADTQKLLRRGLARQLGVRKPEIREHLGIPADEQLTSNRPLFGKLQKILKKAGLQPADYFLQTKTIPEAIEAEITELIDLQAAGIETEIFVVELFPKSSPDAVVAGNDTACCMPFGSGKNNVYMWNPIAGQLCVQRFMGNGEKRTVAQSIMTEDRDVGISVPTIMEKMGDHTALEAVIPEDKLLAASKGIITADNVEVAPNFKGQPGAGELLHALYYDFLREYAARYAANQNLDASQCIIGQGFSDSLKHLSSVPNTYIPAAPLGYSDNIAEESYKLDLQGKSPALPIVKRTVHASAVREIPDTLPGVPKGISPLTYRDTLAVAYLEGKAYADNVSLREHLHNLENGLIAKDINNAHKDRPNMSLKYEEGGKTLGYMIAYEGTADVSDAGSEESVLYVADMASVPDLLKRARAGANMLKGFMQLWNDKYIQQGNFIPVLARAREQTSYRMILRQLNRLKSQYPDITFEIKELNTDQIGEDTMHTVVIRPSRPGEIKDLEDLAA